MASHWERLYEEARNLHQAGRLDDALTLYQQVVAGSPSHGGAMHMLGLIAYQIGRTDTAVDLLAQAAVMDPLVGADGFAEVYPEERPWLEEQVLTAVGIGDWKKHRGFFARQLRQTQSA